MAGASVKVWFLEGLFGPRKTLQRIRLSRYPFVVGRQEGLSLVLDSPSISRQHAQLEEVDGRLIVTDLGSTNGTFVNRNRISDQLEVSNGDIIHFGEEEFRAISDNKNTGLNLKLTQQGIGGLPENLPAGGAQLQQMLLEARVTSVFQPIIERDSGRVHAYEMLGRGLHPSLTDAPAELFRIAESLGLDIQLSELMRRIGCRLAAAADPSVCYFTNIHPREVENPMRLVGEMHRLRERYDQLKLVLELHESAVADRSLLEDLRARMNELDIRIAYDDFGAGQARLMELAEVPPDYVKIDRALIQNIHDASPARQEMVRMVVRYARDRNIRTIAEGVSGQAEAAYCGELGFELMQGYHFGRPAALSDE